MSYGPDWVYTLGLIGFAIGAAGYFYFMMDMLTNIGFYLKSGHAFLILLNVSFLFRGILQDPGLS